MKETIFLLSTLLIFGLAFCAPKDSFVVSSTDSSTGNGKEGTQAVSLHPIIYEMNITANISNRFAKTLVVSRVKNSDKSAKQTTFTVVLPEKAFISEFVMEIDGKSYKAYVKEKEEAKQIYNEAVARGQSAGHVAVSARDSNRFTVSVNIEPESKAAFLLTYEELLERKQNQYELVLNIHPGQIVKHLNVKVQINESRPLTFVKTPSLRSGNEISKNKETLDPSSDIEIINATTAVVKFSPDSEKQKEFARGLGAKESDGLSGQFIVQYDVERDPRGGEVLLDDGYFVHFFAPSDLEPLPKHVVFTLDTSGSMWGNKILQVKDAMNSILNEIKQDDIISIIEFNSYSAVWDIASENKTLITYNYEENYQEPFPKLSKLNLPTPVLATNETINKAKNVIERLVADGGTHMIGGLETALYLVKLGQENNATQTNRKYQPIIIFLTDGEPNGGIWDTEEIVSIVTRLNSENNNVPIYSLSFGEGADKAFLRKISLKNQAFSRHIYEASDASLQLQEFYKEISSPLLSNVNFKYNTDVKEVTKAYFPVYYGGSELVVTGRYEDTDSDFEGFITCTARPGPSTLRPRIEKPVTSLERLWAYLTIKQLLEEKELEVNKTEVTQKALNLALKYSFVTDVTSLVVVKPNDTRAVDTEEANAKNNDNSGLAPLPISAGRPAYYPVGLAGPPAQSGRVAAVQTSYYDVDYDASPSSKILTFHGAPGAPGISLLRGPSGPSVGNYGGYGAPGSAIRYPGAYPSTPFFPPPSPPTTSVPTLEDNLPWLTSVLNSNRSLNVSQGVYDLGEHYHGQTPNTECPKTPVNSTQTGICTLLRDCPEVYPALTDFQVYQRYFCPIDNKYAGVCCPKRQNTV